MERWNANRGWVPLRGAVKKTRLLAGFVYKRLAVEQTRNGARVRIKVPSETQRWTGYGQTRWRMNMV